MATNRFLIAPIDAGIRTDLKPWLIPDQAFSRLVNAYIFRGRVKKRFGSKVIDKTYLKYPYIPSCLGMKIGVLDGNGDLAATVVPGIIWKPGQYFVVGPTLITNDFLKLTVTTTGLADLLAPLGSGTFDTTTGTVTLTIHPLLAGLDVYYYPAEPVMGIITYETNAINAEQVYAFDTQFAYRFTLGRWVRVGTAVWTGSNAQLFWGITYRGAKPEEGILFVTNNAATDPIRFALGTTWTDYAPQYGALVTDIIKTARLIVSFKGRLLLMNTTEGATSEVHVNRLRYSLNGNPLVQADPLDPLSAYIAFDEITPGKGGFIDAPTREAIITCEFLKDRLIVFFEQSTWELVYTGNEILPFHWQQIDSSLGAESTFSIVPFDKISIGVGNVGIHACNGANVERIDQNIPDEIFKIHNDNDGPQRVVGIRDFYTEMIYWAYPYFNESVFPNRILVYNYKAGTWAMNEDSFTCFGYFQSAESTTWENSNFTWAEFTMTWDYAPEIAQFRSVVAGNQQGWITKIDSEATTNAYSLHISNWVGDILTIYNHNLAVEEFIKIQALYTTHYVQVCEVKGKDSIRINLAVPEPDPYDGTAYATRLSCVDILTKEYNFFSDKGRNSALNRVDFYLTKASEGGQFAVDYYVSSSTQDLIKDAKATNTILGVNTIETAANSLIPLETSQDRLWRSFYLSADGMTVQLELYFSDAQMINEQVHVNPFELHAMMFYAQPTSMNMN